MKPVVRYRPYKDHTHPEIGRRTILCPIDHPSPHVSNTCEVMTSPVVAYEYLTGRIETENTIYRLEE